MAKGGSFERLIAVQLSEWWTNGERDDVYWRSSNSGGRATARHKKGKRTAGQYGDIAAIDPIGKPLLDLMTLSLKRGYSDDNLHSLLDASANAKEQKYQKWMNEAYADCCRAKSFSWALLTRRDRREPLLFMPDNLAKIFEHRPIASFYTTIDSEEGALGIIGGLMHVYLWEDWLEATHPDGIRDFVKGLEQNK